MTSLNEILTEKYNRALDYYDANPESENRYDIELIEARIQYIYKMLDGKGSLLAILNFDLERECDKLFKMINSYYDGKHITYNQD